MKVGDLVCYNCAGMKDHTMGLVMSEWFDAKNLRYIRIMWAVKGRMMPRASYDYYHKHNLANPDWQTGPEGGRKDILWYEADKNYFKVLQ